MPVGAEFPIKALSLFRSTPYKVMYGGRGGSKTWDFCRALLILGSREPLFILCARELQKSIAESTHRTLVTQIEPLGLSNFYTVLSHKIIGKEKVNRFTGRRGRTEFVFAGIKNNITAIKSMEGIDICAVFEANGVTQHSWDILLPTIRRDAPHGPFGKGSEVWVEFNPELGTDETYKRWVLDPPQPVLRLQDHEQVDAYLKSGAEVSSVVTEINWRDNDWFPNFLHKQKEELKKKDYESYLTIWEGHIRRVLQGAIYAKELEAAQKANRISANVVHNKSHAVDVAVDLGRADTCALWFVQQWGMEHHFIGYYANFGCDWSHYLEEMQGRGYRIGKIYLPHDAAHEQLAAKKSIVAQTRDAYPNDGQVVVVPRTPNVANDINAVRLMFSRFFFAEKSCADGLQALAHYRYEVDEETREVSPKPLHDWASHCADALRCYVMGLVDYGRHSKPQYHMPNAPLTRTGDRLGWMQ